ncbi:hypothetical protein G6F65_016117 [Rhizopus arrhizus]|nr:hypothetical protein G6F65_016117 [Rhizopus arrhizus]
MLADHGRDVRLEQAVANDDGGQAELEDVLLRQRDHEQAGGHDDRAGQDRALVAQYPVGHVATEDRRGVHQGQVGTVDAAGVAFTGSVAVVELGDDVQHQGPADAVERKAFPELGHEQHPQRARMAQRGLEVRQGRLWGVRSGVYAHAGFLVRWMTSTSDVQWSNARGSPTSGVHVKYTPFEAGHRLLAELASETIQPPAGIQAEWGSAQCGRGRRLQAGAYLEQLGEEGQLQRLGQEAHPGRAAGAALEADHPHHRPPGPRTASTRASSGRCPGRCARTPAAVRRRPRAAGSSRGFRTPPARHARSGPGTSGIPRTGSAPPARCAAAPARPGRARTPAASARSCCPAGTRCSDTAATGRPRTGPARRGNPCTRTGSAFPAPTTAR